MHGHASQTGVARLSDKRWQLARAGRFWGRVGARRGGVPVWACASPDWAAAPVRSGLHWQRLPGPELAVSQSHGVLAAKPAHRKNRKTGQGGGGGVGAHPRTCAGDSGGLCGGRAHLAAGKMGQ